MLKQKLTCKDVGMLATNDQRCLKNTDRIGYIKRQMGIRKITKI